MHPALSRMLAERLIDRRDDHRRRVLDLFRRHVAADRSAHEYASTEQGRRLQALLAHARDHVPRFRAHIPGDLPEDLPGLLPILRGIPPMTRDEIQKAPASFVADNARDLRDDFTGGSTGTPMTFKIDQATQLAREASLYWANSLAGWRPGERIAMLWGSDRDTSAARRDWKLEFRWVVDNMRWYNAFNMGEQEMERFHREMSRFRPHLIVAYAGSLHVYSRFLRELGIKPDYPITALVSSAEVLAEPVRRDIEDVFNMPVFNRYGNREAGAIAAECSAHQGLHILEDDFLVEVDSENPSATPGAILITYFRNHGMPLIRYNTGDLGLLETAPCSCGRTSSRLARIVGRESDTIRTAHGQLIHGEYFTHVLYGAEGVREFRFVQETMTRYRLLVVAEGKSMQEETWRKKIASMLAPGDELIIDYVDHIPVLASGKRRFTLSEVDKG